MGNGDVGKPSLFTKIKDTWAEIKELKAAKDAGPCPNLDPKAILKEIEKDPVLKGVLDGKYQLQDCTWQLTTKKEQEAVIILQRALLTLRLINVDMSKKYWWKKPGLYGTEKDGGFAWGYYGPKTIKAVAELQEIADLPAIERAMPGQVFGKDSLKMLIIALNARAEGKDWRAAVEKASSIQEAVKGE